ncbi:hypothetical protein OHB41_46140 [Streptomyces sp. NBC_01571]|uniref:hypothetical protein n=1 Tax=Streptomyces sp. NBC_01571 TaxID=2975883 RepID=UPI0022588C20|nr:hypothetical protein [Streptomyces sp. NBC_01571]MCX4580415.1 hypothetical protein [Streptomyces sp. NBC_01571]
MDVSPRLRPDAGIRNVRTGEPDLQQLPALAAGEGLAGPHQESLGIRLFDQRARAARVIRTGLDPWML